MLAAANYESIVLVTVPCPISTCTVARTRMYAEHAGLHDSHEYNRQRIDN